jgi:polar amino acid transport system permease protein
MDVILRNLPFLLKGTFPNGPIGGLALTIYLSLTIGAASFGVGVVFALATFLPYRPMRWVVRALSIVIRGVPSLAFLFWMYFLVPQLLHINLSPFVSAGLALSIYHGAYMGEDIRGGIQAVPKGQWEAARASGLSFLSAARDVVMPQALRAVVPILINRFVNLLMYTSVVSVLGILEFTRAGVLVNNRELIYPVQIFGFVGIVYFVLCYLLTRLGRYLEIRWNWAPTVGTLQTAV